MNNNLSYEVKKILKNAEKECMSLNHPYVGTEHLLLSLLKNEEISKITKKYNLTYKAFRNELINIVGKSSKKSEVILYTPLLRLVIDASMKEDTQNEFVIFRNLLTSDDGIALRLLISMDIDLESLMLELKETDTLELSLIGERVISNNILIGRDKEIEAIIEILLRKNKNNPVLIGEAGVGKTAIVEELARRCEQNLVPSKLRNKKIISLDMASMLSNTKYRGEFETRLNNIIKEVKNNNNIILFIDEIHTIVKTGGGEGSIDAANILKPYLANDKIKIIGATTTYEYEKYIVPDKALKRRFQSVMINEPNEEETTNILLGVKKKYEEFHNIKITDNNIKTIVSMANRYIHNNHNPDKSLDLLDLVSSRVVLKNFNYIKEEKIEEYLKNKDYKNAYLIKKDNNKKPTITNDIIEETVSMISGIKIIKDKDINLIVKTIEDKYQINVKNIFNKLLNSSLLSINLLGEDKLIKEEFVKLIQEQLNYNYIELDLKDYTSDTSINRIIGSDPGYIGYNDYNFISKIKYKPYSLIYLKNIIYGSSKVTSLFKSIVEKGYVVDNKGDKVIFNNCLIIFDMNKENNVVGYNKKQNNIHDNYIDMNMIKIG